MKKMAVVAFLAAFILNCSNKPTNSNHEITISITPSRALVNLGAVYHFTSSVEGANDPTVLWTLEGSTENGTINTSGDYTAPIDLVAGVDSVMITARVQEDTSKSANAWAVLVDPGKIFVDMLGSDSIGIGTRWRPYRTITKALYRAQAGQIIVVSTGQYDMAAGERFPLHITTGITVQGAGSDSTFVIGPGGMDPDRDAIFSLNGDIIVLEKMCIKSSNSLGVGISMKQGRMVEVSHNQISQNYIGIYVSGSTLPRPVLEANNIVYDSIGIVTADSSGPVIRSDTISQCHKYGMEIRDISRPDIGINDSTNAGNNTINNCGDITLHWLIYNGSPDTIFAVGNHWPFEPPEDNDIYIYDNEESGGASGPVILH